MYQPVKMPYAYSSLQPYIDEKTMFVHYNEHYLGYLKKLNALVPSHQPIKSLITNIKQYSDEVRNNAGGYYNHSLFWNMLKPATAYAVNEPTPLVLRIIKRDFGSFDNFKKQIVDASKKRFGSGWVWWILRPTGETMIVQTPYQDNPLMINPNIKILLGIDVWEHAYYLQYQSKRESYVNNIFNIINWDYPHRILSKR